MLSSAGKMKEAQLKYLGCRLKLQIIFYKTRSHAHRK